MIQVFAIKKTPLITAAAIVLLVPTAAIRPASMRDRANTHETEPNESGCTLT